LWPKAVSRHWLFNHLILAHDQVSVYRLPPPSDPDWDASGCEARPVLHSESRCSGGLTQFVNANEYSTNPAFQYGILLKPNPPSG
jgi:hypothetical protein